MVLEWTVGFFKNGRWCHWSFHHSQRAAQRELVRHQRTDPQINWVILHGKFHSSNFANLILKIHEDVKNDLIRERI